MKDKLFKYRYGQIKLPAFFPDATRAVVKTLDFVDIEGTYTPGVLVNTYHLWRGLGKEVLKKFDGINKFMGWNGATISDSGGFQIMSLIKNKSMAGRVTDEGVTFHPTGERKMILTPEKSIQFQMTLKTDLMVVLDDFTDPGAGYKEAEVSVDRTIDWAQRSKSEFEKICKARKLGKDKRPYLIGVVQGGEFKDLREKCTQALIKIGFDGLGWGGWPMVNGKMSFMAAEVMAELSPSDYLLYGLGIGKPDEIVRCVELGFDIFDCVLPTRDGRHGRLYIYNFDTINEINVRQPNFYSYFTPDKEKHYYDKSPVSTACDCLLCKKYSRAYLSHLFRMNEISAMRLASIHNLRFYSILMEKLRT